MAQVFREMQLRHNRTNRNDLAICPVAFPEGDQCAHWSSLKPVLCSNPFSSLSLSFSSPICYTHSIMRDCDHCQLMRNETCSGFTCLGFKPVGYIDVEALKNAAERLDNSRRSRSKHSSRRVQEAAERVKHARLPEHQASSAPLERRKMSCNNGYLRKQCQDKVDWEMEVCDRAGTPEEQKTILRDSEFEIYYNDRNEGENTVLMDPDWIFMDEGISDKEWEEVEKRLDADRLREADRWLLDIETDALRDAIRRLRKGQQNLIRLCFIGYFTICRK